MTTGYGGLHLAAAHAFSSIFFLVGCGAPDGDWDPMADEPFDAITESAQTFPAPANASGSGICAGNGIDYQKPTPPSGWSIVRFELERARSSSGPWSVVKTGSASKVTLNDLFPLRGKTYRYRVRAVYNSTQGQSATSGPSNTVTIAPSDCAIPRATSGSTMKVNVILVSPSAEPKPFDSAWADKVTFDASYSNSLKKYLREISAGADHTSSIPQVRISGKVVDWQSLNKARISNYPGGIREMCKEYADSGKLAAVTQANPADYQILVFNSGAQGGESGCINSQGQQVSTGHALMLGAGSLKFARPYGTMAHEMLHVLGLEHEPRMYCSGGLPANLATTLSACSVATYDSTVSVMSRGESGNHPSAYHKWKLGFLTDANLTLVDARSMTAGQSISKTIVQSTQTQNSSAKQILAVQLDDAENMLIFQYRIAAGFDNKTLRGDDWITFPAGVYVSLRPGQDWAKEDLYLLYSANNQLSPVLLTQGGIFSDSARKLSFEVTSLTGGTAKIKVRRF